MKAKEYYEKLKQCETEEQFNNELCTTLKGLLSEAQQLIKTRHCKTYSAIRSVVSEINNKWHTLVRLYNNEDNNLGLRLNDDGFYLVLCDSNPEYKDLFKKEYNRGIKTIKENEEKIKEAEEKAKEAKDLYFHEVLPLNEITNENIATEIINCLYSLSNFAKIGPLEWARPLADRITFLQYWKKNGINYDQIEEFEKDHNLFFTKYKVMEYLDR